MRYVYLKCICGCIFRMSKIGLEYMYSCPRCSRCNISSDGPIKRTTKREWARSNEVRPDEERR